MRAYGWLYLTCLFSIILPISVGNCLCADMSVYMQYWKLAKLQVKTKYCSCQCGFKEFHETSIVILKYSTLLSCLLHCAHQIIHNVILWTFKATDNHIYIYVKFIKSYWTIHSYSFYKFLCALNCDLPCLSSIKKQDLKVC